MHQAYTATLCEHRGVSLFRRRRSLAAQAELERAVAAIDRELAANLELTTMFDQTRQAVVLENAEFERNRAVIARELPDTAKLVAEVYSRIVAAEDAMGRRGPAGSLRDADRATIESWEGDAREAQRTLRTAATAAPPSLLDSLRRPLHRWTARWPRR